MIKVTCLSYELLKARLADILYIENNTIDRFGDLYDKSVWTEIEFCAVREKKDKFSCIILNGDKVMGFSIAYEVKEGYAHISRLAVLSDAGKKYGSTLLDFQLQILNECKIKTCSVDLISSNKIARSLYGKRGFKKLESDELLDYINFKERDPGEYLGENPSHIAMLRRI